MPNVSDVIRRDHRMIDERLKRFEMSSDPAIAIDACDMIKHHTMLEEAILYPDLRMSVSTDLWNHSESEHDEIKSLIDEIERCEDESQFALLVSSMRHKLLHHIREEEAEVLPAMERQLSADRMNELGERFSKARTRRNVGEAVIDVNAATASEKEMRAHS